MGGHKPDPSYREVCTGTTGHAEVVYLWYDPTKVNYEDLVRFFFRIHDPTTKNKQGNDRGSQYRSAIFFYSEEQQEKARQVLEEIASDASKMKSYSSSKIVTEIMPATPFFKAEDNHQAYLKQSKRILQSSPSMGINTTFFFQFFRRSTC